ncbi:MAG: hypothetical protein M1522_00370 [Actinobacteria bacterium]|nr:hypothetical protein [Actinomycetota bacterium]
MSSNEDEGLWLAMTLLGLHPGKDAALTWQDVDLGGGVLHVVHPRKWTPRGSKSITRAQLPCCSAWCEISSTGYRGRPTSRS